MLKCAKIWTAIEGCRIQIHRNCELCKIQEVGTRPCSWRVSELPGSWQASVLLSSWQASVLLSSWQVSALLGSWRVSALYEGLFVLFLLIRTYSLISLCRNRFDVMHLGEGGSIA